MRGMGNGVSEYSKTKIFSLNCIIMAIEKCRTNLSKFNALQITELLLKYYLYFIFKKKV